MFNVSNRKMAIWLSRVPYVREVWDQIPGRPNLTQRANSSPSFQHLRN